jgi:hypothetical protein
MMDQKSNSVRLSTAGHAWRSESRGVAGQGTQQVRMRMIRHVRQFAAMIGEIGLLLCISGMFFSGGCGSEISAAPTVRIRKQDRGATAKAAVQDLGNEAIKRLCAERAKAVVLIFTRTDCPIANRYAPEIRRLTTKFAPQGVLFRLVYPEASETPEAIREHLTAFQYPCEAWRDPAHVFVRHFGVTVTPEVVVFVPDGKLTAYRGRIDDLYVDFGRARAAPTTHELEEALEAVLSDRPVGVATTTAVGCSIGGSP